MAAVQPRVIAPDSYTVGLMVRLVGALGRMLVRTAEETFHSLYQLEPAEPMVRMRYFRHAPRVPFTGTEADPAAEVDATEAQANQSP